MTTHLVALSTPGLPELIVIAIIGLLLFGKRLPEVGKSLGKGIVEFKKGLKSIEDEVTTSTTTTQVDRPMIQADHKFDPYTGKPLAEPASDPTSLPPSV